MPATQFAYNQLWLFDCGGVDVSALKERGENLKTAARARETVDGYASDWSLFGRWCDSVDRERLPATAETVELYVTWMLTEKKRKISTAERHTSAIAHYHRVAGYESPLRPGLRDIIRAVRRERKENPEGKAAIGHSRDGDLSELHRLSAKCDDRTAMGTRDRAIIVLGFATTFRRSELARLQLADVSFERKGLAVLLRHSKQDQAGRGRLLGVWKGDDPLTDPVRTAKAWIKRRGTWPGPLFCRVQTGDHVTRRPISGEAISEAVKRIIAAIGLNPDLYGAHSLRAGGITAAADNGCTDQEIMRLSGHRSHRVMQTYVRPRQLFSGRNPLAGVL